MSNYSIKAFFQTYPKAKEAFETYDGILHPNRAIAEKWVERHASKIIIVHNNPFLKKGKQGRTKGKEIEPPVPEENQVEGKDIEVSAPELAG